MTRARPSRTTTLAAAGLALAALSAGGGYWANAGPATSSHAVTGVTSARYPSLTVTATRPQVIDWPITLAAEGSVAA